MYCLREFVQHQDISSVLIILLILFTCIFDLALILFGEI